MLATPRLKTLENMVEILVSPGENVNQDYKIYMLVTFNNIKAQHNYPLWPLCVNNFSQSNMYHIYNYSVLIVLVYLHLQAGVPLVGFYTSISVTSYMVIESCHGWMLTPIVSGGGLHYL